MEKPLNGKGEINKTPLMKKIVRHKTYYLMFLPAVILLILFSYKPMVGIVIAFKDYHPGISIWESPWAGLKNFAFITRPDFTTVVKNTIVVTGLRMLFGFPAPILLALMFNEVNAPRFKKISQSIVYLPHFMSWIVVAYILESLLSPSVGLVNQIITGFGGEAVSFFTKPEYFRTIIVASSLWKETGWGTIIYLATIATIDPQLHEAAMVEGANRLQRIWHITLPSIMPTISVLLVLNIPNLLNAGMDQILPLTNPANLSVADVLDTYILRNGVEQGQYAVSTAVGLMSSAIKLVLLLGTNWMSIKLSGSGLWESPRRKEKVAA